MESGGILLEATWIISMWPGEVEPEDRLMEQT